MNQKKPAEKRTVENENFKKLLGSLSPGEKEQLRLWLNEVAERMRRMREIEAKALRMLRNPSRHNRLKAFLDGKLK